MSERAPYVGLRLEGVPGSRGVLVVWIAFVWLISAMSVTAQQKGDLETSGVSFGLNGISDWSTQHPFLNVMRTARPWIGHLPNQWGGVDMRDLRNAGVVGQNGWPGSIPEHTNALETLILTDQPSDAAHLAGRYRVTYQGNGRLEITGRGRVVSRNPFGITFEYRPGPGHVGVRLLEINPDDPIRDIVIVNEAHLSDFRNGDVFNPDWLQLIGSAPAIRFMDWSITNESDISSIEGLPRPTDFSYAWRGAPLRTMIALANKTGSDPWFTIPHKADDELVRYMAETVERELRPDLVAHVEYSNEVWNFVFEQARWAEAQAEARWGGVDAGWIQYYGFRAAQVMHIWTDVFGASSEHRLKRIVAVHTGWPGLEQAALFGDMATRDLGYAPVEAFDAYAVTGYFGYDAANPETLDPILDEAEDRSRKTAEAEGLSRVALREYVRQNRFDGVMPAAADIVRNGSLRALTKELWPYHAKVAAQNDLEFIMYEGGTHAAAPWEAIDNERLVEFLTAFNYSDEMGKLYVEALTAWSELSEAPFNAFVDVAPPSKWGSWGALRHLDDDNPRWRALQGFQRDIDEPSSGDQGVDP